MREGLHTVARVLHPPTSPQEDPQDDPKGHPLVVSAAAFQFSVVAGVRKGQFCPFSSLKGHLKSLAEFLLLFYQWGD